MKMDIVFLIFFVLFGALAGAIFLKAMEKAALKQPIAVNQKLDELLGLELDIQAKLNYKTGDVAAQMSRMNDRLLAIEKKLNAS